MNYSHFNGRVFKLEQAQDEDDAEPQIIIRPAWWEVIGEGDDA